MPGYLLHVNVGMQCLHQAPAKIVPAQLRVLVSGQPVVTMASMITVMGCLFTIPGPKPQPCLTIKWSLPSARVLFGGQPAMIQAAPGPGAGIGLSGTIPNGPPVVSAFQALVFAM